MFFCDKTKESRSIDDTLASIDNFLTPKRVSMGVAWRNGTATERTNEIEGHTKERGTVAKGKRGMKGSTAESYAEKGYSLLRVSVCVCV